MKYLAVFIVLFSVNLFALDQYQVTFETTLCSGEKGFANVDIKKIERIESAECTYEEKKLQKMLVRDGSSYKIYMLTYDQAKEVMQDIKLYNRAKLKMMQNSNAVIISK